MAVTVRLIVVVWLKLSETPVMVTVTVPVVAVLLAEKVSAELPLPGAAIEVGLKLAVTPEGKPDTDNETTALKPPLTVLEMVVVPEPLGNRQAVG